MIDFKKRFIVPETRAEILLLNDEHQRLKSQAAADQKRAGVLLEKIGLPTMALSVMLAAIGGGLSLGAIVTGGASLVAFAASTALNVRSFVSDKKADKIQREVLSRPAARRILNNITPKL